MAIITKQIVYHHQKHHILFKKLAHQCHKSSLLSSSSTCMLLLRCTPKISIVYWLHRRLKIWTLLWPTLISMPTQLQKQPWILNWNFEKTIQKVLHFRHPLLFEFVSLQHKINFCSIYKYYTWNCIMRLSGESVYVTDRPSITHLRGI